MNFTINKENLLIISCIVLLLFSGVWQFFGMPTYAIKGLFFTILIAFCLFQFFQGQLRLTMNAILTFYLILILMLVLLNQHSKSLVLTSMFQIFSPLIIFHLLDAFLRNIDHNKAFRLLLFFLIIQISAAFIKLAVFGQGEGNGIGTLSIQAGSVSTFIVTVFCVLALHFRQRDMIFYTALFFVGALLFAIINEKRLGILIVFTLVLFLGFNLQSWRFSGTQHTSRFIVRLGTILAVSLLAVFALLIGQLFVPTLTEGYTLLTIMPRIETYLFAIESDGTAIGRFAGMMQMFDDLQKHQTLFMGMGPDALLSTAVVEGKQQETSFRPVGMIIVMSRFGLVGLAIFAIFFFSLWRRSTVNLASMILVAYIFLDFLFYSDSLFVSHAMQFILLLILRLPSSTQLLEVGTESQKYYPLK